MSNGELFRLLIVGASGYILGRRDRRYRCKESHFRGTIDGAATGYEAALEELYKDGTITKEEYKRYSSKI